MKVIQKLLSASIYCAWLSSCGIFSIGEEIKLIWPQDDLAVFQQSPPESWRVEWLAKDNAIHSRQVRASAKVIVTVPKERPVIIKAVPHSSAWPNGFRFKPAGYAGTVLPKSPASVTLSWESGFAADYLLSVARAGGEPARINIDRFAESVTKAVAIKKNLHTPWEINTRELSADVLSRELWYHSFKALPGHKTRVPLPPGNWYSDYPPAPPIQLTHDGRTDQISEGMHSFIRPSDNSTALVQIDTRGNAIVSVSSPE